MNLTDVSTAIMTHFSGYPGPMYVAANASSTKNIAKTITSLRAMTRNIKEFLQ